MKILDVDLFQEGLQRNIIMIDRLSSEMKAIQHAVEGLVQMEDQLKGAGGNAIRSFYQECHLPFLHFFQLFSDQFKQVLNQMEAALHSLEPDSAGYILEIFLDGELEQGLTLISEITASLTEEANSIMDQVSDIVALPHLDDSGVQEGVITSKRKRDDTLMQLYEFDATQTYALNQMEQALDTMDTWLTGMEGLFQAGVKDINFSTSQWDVLTLRSDIKTALFPKVYLDPNDVWLQEQKQLIGTMITAATFQTLESKKVTTIEENVTENIKYHQYDNGLLIKEYVFNQTVFYEVVSKVEYKEEAVIVEKPKENKLLDSFQFVLDIAGLIPGVGELADGANGLIYTARGDTLNATLSFSAMIPFAGWASTGGKFINKGSDLYSSRNVLSTEKVESLYSPSYQDVVNSPLGKTHNQLDILSNTDSHLVMPNALKYILPPAKTEIPTSIKSGDVNFGAKGTGNKTDKIPDGAIRDGSHMGTDGVLKPNVTYKAGEYEYLYETDNMGRLKEFNADDLKLTERDSRLPHKSNTPGKETGDHAGHLAGDRFGGSPDLDNLVSQSSNVNLSKYKKLENQWAAAIKEGKKVSVNVKVNYEETGLRPTSFEIKYNIDDVIKKVRLKN
ncbi:DNA/RNA non-specific endonuclease [Psychrobacillus sp. OK028]|uniref:T7SS effector LXG polymorphic toxin n=1 Tax=Psychrobacillus sp. OK028 TaxID=1884359 RepID=UPI0008911B2C|nr:T7SS effector LXG polymorphic toxin [Psychrobacillus sp. OK028]SDN22122.1 DNA/RNA non-specific endonuclease [Psychrobacillus sp. OK028]